jgi:hypothetical protein
MLQVTWDLKTWVDSPALLFTGMFFYFLDYMSYTIMRGHSEGLFSSFYPRFRQ